MVVLFAAVPLFAADSYSIRDLGTLGGPFSQANAATGIDDTGQIVGYGTFHGEQHAFALTPDGASGPRRRAVK